MTITTKPTAPIVQTPVPEPAKSPDSTASGAANARASVPAKLTPKAPTVQAAQQPKVAPPTIKDGFAPIGAMGPRKTAATFAAGTTSALAKTEDTNITNISQMKFGQKAPAGLMKAADIKETVNAALAKSSYATQIGAFVTGHDPLKDTFGVESTATSRIPKAGSFYNVKSMADHGAVVTKAYSELYTGLSPEKTEIRKAHITRALVMINANIATEKELSTVLSKSSSSIDISTPKGEAAATVMRDGMLLKNMSLASQHPAKMGTFMLPSKEFMHEAVKAFGDTNPDGSYIELSEKEFPIMSDLFGSVEEFTKARDGQVSAWDKKRNAEVKKATAASAGASGPVSHSPALQNTNGDSITRGKSLLVDILTATDTAANQPLKKLVPKPALVVGPVVDAKTIPLETSKLLSTVASATFSVEKTGDGYTNSITFAEPLPTPVDPAERGRFGPVSDEVYEKMDAAEKGETAVTNSTTTTEYSLDERLQYGPTTDTFFAEKIATNESLLAEASSTTPDFSSNAIWAKSASSGIGLGQLGIESIVARAVWGDRAPLTLSGNKISLFSNDSSLSLFSGASLFSGSYIKDGLFSTQDKKPPFSWTSPSTWGWDSDDSSDSIAATEDEEALLETTAEVAQEEILEAKAAGEKVAEAASSENKSIAQKVKRREAVEDADSLENKKAHEQILEKGRAVADMDIKSSDGGPRVLRGARHPIKSR